jgi:uncharacterized protein YjiS (DUF1127 family)
MVATGHVDGGPTMKTITSLPTLTERPALAVRLQLWLRAAVEDLAESWAERRALGELQSLSTATLKDLALDRSELASLVRERHGRHPAERRR